MRKLASIVIVTIFGGGAVACLVPSFDGMSGEAGDAPVERTPTTRERETASTTADGGGASSSSGAPGSTSGSGGAAIDGGGDAGPRTYQCNPRVGSERCLLHTQDCCFEFIAGGKWSCVAHGDTFGCTGVSTCGDNSDCGAGETCCFAGTTGKCEKGACPNGAYRTCDRSKPKAATCDGDLACTYPHEGTKPPRCY